MAHEGWNPVPAVQDENGTTGGAMARRRRNTLVTLESESPVFLSLH
jgi:hypothetical protein